MKKNRFIITFLVITAMLVSVMAMPMTAIAADGPVLYEFAMSSTKPGTSEASPVAYNVSWDEADVSAYQDRELVDRKWKHWFDVNYTSIGTGDDFTAFCMEYTNETKVPGLYKDFSAYAASGYAIFDVELEDTVDINNLYLAIATLSGGTTAYAGVPVSKYVSDDNRAASVAIPFADFEKSEAFIGGKTDAATAIDFSKFTGMGIIRKQVSDAESSGKVYFAKMAVAGFNAPVDLAATTAKNVNTISFTMPAGITAKTVSVNVTDDSDNQRNITTKIADWTEEAGVYSWTDTGVDVERGYTYKIKITEATYGVESAYSNTAYVFVEEDYTGNDMPADAITTEVESFSNRNFTWYNGCLWHERILNTVNSVNLSEEASSVGMGTGRVASYTLNYNQRSTKDQNDTTSFFADDWYFSGFAYSEDQKGGTSGADRMSRNIDAYADTANAYFQIYVEEGVDLNNLYITLAGQWAGGVDYIGNLIGLPIADFVSEEDKGKVLDIVIPLSKFTLDYPGMKQEQVTYTWNASEQPSGVEEIDWTHFWGMGFMRDDSNPGISSGKIYCSEMKIIDVKPATELRVHDIKQGKVILSWKHSESAVEKYNIYRKDLETGEYTLIGESKADMFVDTNGDVPFEADKTYEYKVEAVDKNGVVSSAAEVTTYMHAIDSPRNFAVNNVYSDAAAAEVVVSWSPAQYGDVQKYILYRDGQEYQTFDATVKKFVDTDVVANTRYEYYMVAANADESTVSTETKHISVLATPIAAPENLGYSVVDAHSIKVLWDAVDFAETYLVYLNDELYDEITDVEYTIDNLEFYKEYTIDVVAKNAGGAVSGEVTTGIIILDDPDAVESEDYTGSEIPATANATEIVDFSNRNYEWSKDSLWGDRQLHTVNSINLKEEASTLGMGEGKIISYTLNYNQRPTKDQNTANSFFADDWYFGGFAYDEKQKGGISGTDRLSRNISTYADTASAYFQVYISTGVDLNNLYITLANQWAGGTDYIGNFIGLPITDFVSEEDKGKVIDIVIPLSKFTLDYPGMKQEQATYTWNKDAQPGGVEEIDWTHFWGMGFMRDDSNPGKSSGKIYCSEMKIVDVEPVRDLKTYDVVKGKVVLSWKHSKSVVEKYNIYRKDLKTGEYTLIGESKTDMFVDTNSGVPFEADTTYEYKVAAVDTNGVESAPTETSAYVSAIGRPRKFAATPVYSETDTVEITVSWATAQYGDAQKYVLYRDGKEYQTFDTTVKKFVDTDVKINTAYEYYMVATNADGSVSSIETKHISVIAVPVAAPQNLTYSVVDTNSLSLSWDASDFAVNYIVYLDGEKYGETSGTAYTVKNLEFNTHYAVSVVSQNASGAVSNETSIDRIIISNPDIVAVKGAEIFTDEAQNGFYRARSVYAKAMLENEISLSGTSSVMIDFTTRNYDLHEAGFENEGFDIEAYREANNSIAFWIYADYEIDFGNIDFAIASSNTYNKNGVRVYSKVNLGDYVSGYGKWKYVSIPLKAFSEKGVAYVDAYEITFDQKFNEITSIFFMTRNSAVDTLAAFYVDDMMITKAAEWKISEVKSNDGTATTSKIPATASSFDITFDKAISDEQAKELSVYVSDEAGNVLNSYGNYENGVYTITLLEALAPDTKYTVNVSGEEVDFETDSTPAGALDTAIPEAKAEVTASSNGSVIDVTVSIDGDISYISKKYDITIKYDEDKLSLNSEDAVELKGAFKDADVVCTDEDIKISAELDSATVLNGDIAVIEFVKQSSGNADIDVDGTVYYYNEAADKETAVKAAGNKTVKVEISNDGGGSSGDGISTGVSANRGSVGAMGATQLPAAVAGSVVEFTDIYDVPWAQQSIKYLASKGYISGYGDGTYKPAQSVTRAEFVKMCVTVFAIPADSTDSGFADVAQDVWYAKYITAAKNAGLVNGISETHFGVNETISREDMCTIISRIIEKMYIVTEEIYDAPIFEDRDEISGYAINPVTNLYKYGIINGISETEFSPKTEVNRAMAAKVLYAVAMLMN